MEWIRQFLAGFREIKKRAVAAGFSQQDDVGALVDDDLYERDILIAAKRLDCSPVLEERIQAVKDIGHIAWSGGLPVAKFAGNQLVNLVSIINNPDEPKVLKLCSVHAIGEICCGSQENRDKARFLGLIGTLAGLLQTTEPDLGELRRSAISSLLAVICDNFENQKALLATPRLQENVERISKEEWVTWEANEGEQLLRFLGFNVKKNKWGILRSLLLK